MKIGVDLRCLNYAKYTGINSYCIHILDVISNIKVSSINEIEIIGIGLKKTRLLELQKEFAVFKSLFSSFRTLEEYYNSKLNNTKLLEAIIVGQIYLQKSLDSDSLEYFDYIIQPQPRLLKLHPKTKLVSFYHDLFNLKENKLTFNRILNNHRNWKIIAQRCTKVITNSRSTSIDLVKYLDIEHNNIRLIYPGIPNLNALRNDNKESVEFGENNNQSSQNYFVKNPAHSYILAISGIEFRKNWHNLIIAFKQLQLKNNYSKKLVLAGTIVDKKYYNFLLKLIKKHSIKNIKWVIEPDEETKNYLIKGCDFLVYPSFYEGFGFPILEAQNYNKKILTSKNSSLVEINNNPFFVNPNNYISIANGILILDNNLTIENKTVFDWKELELFFKLLLTQE
jgi:glycosyltransferase involved in cell wall biosynthesis